jgi:hypothetical protein
VAKTPKAQRPHFLNELRQIQHHASHAKIRSTGDAEDCSRYP